ncbi:MAG: right-handed parallel beta-helix repeat-containing protein [Victivallales bacterium]|nr:right-handed parallel beta-helix repeat-containing protein [Victivallales bacterium]
MRINVRDLGAVGDGKTLNTIAFQRATDAAKAASEHTVIVVPPGCYLCGTIDLPSHTTLHLEAGSTLKASTDISDFTRNPYIFQTLNLPSDSPCYDYLPHTFIVSYNQEDVIIEGDGIIDGSGEAFWEEFCFDGMPPVENDPAFPASSRVLKPKRGRPVVISFWKCRNVVVRNVRINNASAYTVWPQGCDNVRIQDITIRNSFLGPNTDALDIDCSSNVIISGCDIAAGDDCIALKSDSSRIGVEKPCERVVVSNCIFASTACGIRIGYEGDAPIRDCSFSNIVIHDSKNGLDLLSLTPVKRPDFRFGTPIERIAFSNVVMRNVARPFFVWSGTENDAAPHTSLIRDLAFSDIVAEACGGSFIGSKDDAPIQNLLLSSVRIHMKEHPYFRKSQPIDYPNVWGAGRLPDVLRLHNVANCKLASMMLSREGEDDDIKTTEPPALLRWNRASQLVIDTILQSSDGKIYA